MRRRFAKQVARAPGCNDMGYFSNGTEGMAYEERWCSRCIHRDDETGCAVMLAHNLHNYDECNNPASILHMLIPRNGIENEQCEMFIEGTPLTDGDRKYLDWAAAKGLAL